MGYKRESLQILGGGWEILNPGDKAAKQNYLLAQNWKTNKEGKLSSRWGYPLKFSIAGTAYAHSGASAGGVDSAYYIAANVDPGTNPGAIYVNGAATPIMTGLSGKRVGFASMLGWMFIMDRNVSGRHHGSTLVPWGIDPPLTALVAANGAAHPGGTNGTYGFYVTYSSADQFYETGPGPVSNYVTTVDEDIDFSSVPVSPDPVMAGGSRNIYATGGDLAEAYLVAVIPDNITTTATWDTNDLIVTNEGVVMPTTHDQPPAGHGLAGPYFSRLYTWVDNRLYYTASGQPQYWSTDNTVGDWVDVGNSGEPIIWCTAHTNVLMIYKERSIWRLIGDAVGGSLEQVEDGIGLTSAFAITAGAGPVDYFVSAGGLRVCNLDRSALFGPEISPLFNTPIVNTGSPMQPPGSILPPVPVTSSVDGYAIALGFALGKLYVSYRENVPGGSGYETVLAIWDEQFRHWMYARSALPIDRFHGFYFDGLMMVGLTGQVPGAAAACGYNVAPYNVFYYQDEPLSGGAAAPIEVVYQSHFTDVGLPDNQKCWLEVVIDYVANEADTVNVYVGYDNYLDVASPLVGTLTSSMGLRKQVSFTLGDDGVRAKNISVVVKASLTSVMELHNVYLYYYVEERLALIASSLPTDLGTAAVKLCKELIVDIDSSYPTVLRTGTVVSANIYSDLPNNILAIQQTIEIAATGGRALLKFPFATTMGYIWRVALAGETGPFRLYSVRLLMRAIGTYVEAYESAAGFVFDTLPNTFESLLTHTPRSFMIALAMVPIKQFREIAIDCETFGGDVTVSFLTDLPGNAMTRQYTATINTGDAGRRFVRLPLPSDIPLDPGPGLVIPPIEGRLCQLKFSGASAYILYTAAVELLPVGVYIEQYEGAAGAVYDSRPADFGSPKPKDARELEIDIQTFGPVTVTLYCDLPGLTLAVCYQEDTLTTVDVRRKLKLPLTLGTAPFDYPIGRMYQLVISGTSAYKLYDAKLLIREFGCYLTGDETAANPAGVWDSTPIDCGTERLKEFRKIELEVQTDTGGAATLKVWTDQPAGAMTLQFTTTINTAGGRQSVKIPLTPGIRGRLIQVQVSGWGTRLFTGRIWQRPQNEMKEAEWAWFPLPIPPTPPQWTWVSFLVAPTPPAGDAAQWMWGKFLEVTPTPNEYVVVDVPFEVTG